MKCPVLNVDTEFELMVKYQIAIETKLVIITNAPDDSYKYSIVRIEEPFPSYMDYLHGDDFEESVVIKSSNSIEYLLSLQDSKRLKIA